MTKRSRRNHTPAFKAKVALAAMKGDKKRMGEGKVARLFTVRCPRLRMDEVET